MESQEDARDWRGATSRLLEADPDNPGLLLGRGIAEAIVGKGDSALFTSSVTLALRAAYERYAVDARALSRLIVWLGNWLEVRRPTWAALMHLCVQRALPAIAPTALTPFESAHFQHPSPDAGTLGVILERRLHTVRIFVDSSLLEHRETRT